jgi:hypothetical protein
MTAGNNHCDKTDAHFHSFWVAGAARVKREILARERQWLSVRGNRMVFPLPEIEVVTGESLGLAS